MLGDRALGNNGGYFKYRERMSDQTTIIYLTDNALDERLAGVCRRHLLRAAEGKPIVSVSQKPLDFGENICVGEIGRSGLNIDKQIKAGLEQVSTKFVAIAEHDCIYSAEHFNWLPPGTEQFYYNHNCWLLQYNSKGNPEYTGLFSALHGRWSRWLQSQLITGRDSMLRATNQKIEILSDPVVQAGWPTHPRLGEPGIYDVDRVHDVFKKKNFLHVWKAAEKYATECVAKKFKTKIPNIDIRHSDNHTVSRRGKRRRYELSPWGTMEDILNG